MGIRVVVIDDNPHVRWEGRVYPVNATFHQFLAGVLDVPGAPVSSIVHCVPLSEAGRVADDAAPRSAAGGRRNRAVLGIAGYLRHAPSLLRANARSCGRSSLRRTSSGSRCRPRMRLLAGWLAWRAGVPRFGYVAGSALAVARGRGLGLGAQAVGLAYDVAGRVAGGRHRIVVGEGLIGGGGIVTSLVEPEEIRDVSGAPWPAIPWRLRLAWAGRLADGKGLEVLLDALALLVAQEEAGHRVELVVVGDGPARAALEARAARLEIADRIHWLGYVADRATYMDALASCDLFVFPSPAEGFPKVILDAMAVGLPLVVATLSGSFAELGRDRVETTAPGDPVALVKVVSHLVAIPERVRGLRAAGLAFASAHTRQAEATGLVARWRAWLARMATV